jgi:hypothetical protein
VQNKSHQYTGKYCPSGTIDVSFYASIPTQNQVDRFTALRPNFETDEFYAMSAGEVKEQIKQTPYL